MASTRWVNDETKQKSKAQKDFQEANKKHDVSEISLNIVELFPDLLILSEIYLICSSFMKLQALKLRLEQLRGCHVDPPLRAAQRPGSGCRSAQVNPDAE